MFYPFSIKINKCSGNCNNINNPYAKICVPNTVKDLNVRVFILMSKTNETRHIERHNDDDWQGIRWLCHVTQWDVKLIPNFIGLKALNKQI